MFHSHYRWPPRFEPLQVLDWWKSLQVTAWQEADFTLQTDFILSGNLIKMSPVIYISHEEKCWTIQRAFSAILSARKKTKWWNSVNEFKIAFKWTEKNRWHDDRLLCFGFKKIRMLCIDLCCRYVKIFLFMWFNYRTVLCFLVYSTDVQLCLFKS